MDEINDIIDRIIKTELQQILHKYGLIVLKYEETLINYEESEDYELAGLALNEFERQTTRVVDEVWKLFEQFEMTDNMTKDEIRQELIEVNNEIKQELRNEE
jgi:uncharacterized membrane-anchored protein YjiN (DUF445 family)